jgi:hypothetical protein
MALRGVGLAAILAGRADLAPDVVVSPRVPGARPVSGPVPAMIMQLPWVIMASFDLFP